MKNKIDFGNRIIIWQTDHGYSTLEVASIVGTTQPTINRWKRGETLPNYSNFLKLVELGVDFSDIDGVPAREITHEEVKAFCKQNRITVRELCEVLDIRNPLFYNFLKTNDIRDISIVDRIVKFIDGYNGDRKVQKIVEEKSVVESVDIPIEKETTCVDEGCVPLSELPNSEPIKVVTGLNAPAPRSFYKKVTLRELLGFGEKFNIMDAEIITDGGFEVFGFKLVIEEDGVPHLALKTR